MIEYIEHKNIKEKKIQKRLYQELLTAKALDENTLVVAPTGLGKTIVAILLIAYTYKKEKNILLLSPTKPLITQHKKSLDDLLSIDKNKIILLTGSITQTKRKEIYNQKGIIVCATPQTIRNDIQKGYLQEKDYNLIIFDEAHRAVGEYAYVEISSFFNKNIKRLGLTASPGANKKKIQEVADNLKTSHVEIRTETDEDVIDYMKTVDLDVVFTELDEVSKKISLLFENFINDKVVFLNKLNVRISKNYTKKQILQAQAIILERINKTKNKLLFVALSQTASILKVYHAKELIETQGFVSTRKYLEKLFKEANDKKASRALKQITNDKNICDAYKELLNIDATKQIYSKQRLLIDFVNNFIKENPKSKILVFNNFRENANLLMELLNKNKTIKSVRFVGQATKLQDKGLTQKQQSQIIKDFRENKYNVLVCTSVGEEGLDIPSVDLVIFYDAVASEIRSIQRRGRTGRFSAGKVILLLNKGTIDEHYYYVSLNKEKKMKSTLKNYHKTKQIKKKTIFDY
jgi:ERCC4-related helicase